MKPGPALAALLALAGCAGGSDTGAARATVDAFHAALNKDDLAAIDALLTREARQLRPPLGTARAFRNITGRHGRHLVTSGCAHGVVAIDGRDFTSLDCTSRFERAAIRESVVLAEEDGRQKLFSYSYKVVAPGA